MSVRAVERAFTRKLGAERDDSGDHIFFYFAREDSVYTVGKLSHSWSGDLSDTQEQMLAQKLCLQLREFRQFVDCGLSAREMIARWFERRAGRRGGSR